MAITVYVGDNNNTARKRQKSYVGYNNKAVEIFSEPPKIYGVVWGGSANTAWTRTDDAKNFSNPNPYYAGMSGTPGSPFDDIMPWAGMVRSTNANAGEVVAIPKFYYKLGYASGMTGLKIQIAPAANGADWAADNGFKTSPAHMDRGDGKGERDVVYVGRYHCGSDYKSKTGVTPKVNTTRATFRSGISALGSGIYQWDYATLVTLWMLYLVEFADWNSQSKIGYGCGNGSAVQNMGASDNMPYHTGTMQSAKTTYGVGVQYRNIEGLWENVLDWIDGCYNASNVMNIILNPSNFSDTSGGVSVGSPSNGYPSKFTVVDVSGAFPMFIPSASDGSDSTYSCDGWYFNTANTRNVCGGNYAQNQIRGLFSVSDFGSTTSGSVDSRLMVLP